MTSPRFSAVIPAYNEQEALPLVLRDLPKVREVIVVDNASADATAALVAADHPEVTLVASPDNLGFGRGVNLAAERATGDHLVLTSPLRSALTLRRSRRSRACSVSTSPASAPSMRDSPTSPTAFSRSLRTRWSR